MEYEIKAPDPFFHLRIAVDNRKIERGAALSLSAGFGLFLVKSGLALPASPGREARLCRQSQILVFAEPPQNLVSQLTGTSPSQGAGASTSQSASLSQPARAGRAPIAKTTSAILALVFDRDPFPAVEARFGVSRDIKGFKAPWGKNARVIEASDGLGLQVEALSTLVDLAARVGDSQGSESEGASRDFVMVASIAQLCALLAARPDSPATEGEDGRSGPWSIEELIAWIDEHYEEKFSLDEAVRRCAMNTSDFSRRFKELAGSPLFEYLNRRRIFRAALLLRNGELPVIEVAFSVGYNNLSFFNRYFLRLMGQTPTEYRRQSR